MASRTTSNSVFGGGASAGRRRRPGDGTGDGHGGGGRLDPMHDFEVIAQSLGFQDGQLDDRFAQALDVIGERGGFSGGHEGQVLSCSLDQIMIILGACVKRTGSMKNQKTARDRVSDAPCRE